VIRLEYYGGQNEIGGNKILLSNDDTRLFLDFGSSFTVEGAYFDVPFLQPSNLEDLLWVGAVPDMEGLYRNRGVKCQYDDFGFCGTTGKQEKRSINAVLISHAHMDHIGYLGLLRPDIKLYGSSVSKTFLAQKREIWEDFKLKYDDTSFLELSEGQDFEIGSAKIKHIGVDHSIPGASAFIIEMDGLKIGYTGDLRLHGRKPELTENFMRIAADSNLDYLLCEGTRISGSHGHKSKDGEEEEEVESRSCKSEAEVAARLEKYIDEAEGTVVYDSSPADMDRMEMVIEIARAKGRHVLIDSRKAWITHGLNEYLNHYPALKGFSGCSLLLARSKSKVKAEGIPDPKRYKDNPQRYNTILAVKEAYEYFPQIYIENRDERNAWEREIIEHFDNLASQGFPRVFWGPDLRKAIKDDPKKFLVYTSSGANTLMHLGSGLKGTYVYGKAEPFSEEMEISFKKLVKWVNLNNMKFEFAHASGHASFEHLDRIVNTIKPKHLLPIHTTNAELFRQFYGSVGIYKNFTKLHLKKDSPIELS